MSQHADSKVGKFLDKMSDKIKMGERMIGEDKNFSKALQNEDFADFMGKLFKAMLSETRQIIREELEYQLKEKFVLTEGKGTQIKILIGESLFTGNITPAKQK